MEVLCPYADSAAVNLPHISTRDQHLRWDQLKNGAIVIHFLLLHKAPKLHIEQPTLVTVQKMYFI